MTTFEGCVVDRSSLEGQLMKPLRKEVQGAVDAVQTFMETIEQQGDAQKATKQATHRVMASAKRLDLARIQRTQRIRHEHFFLSVIKFYDHHVKNLLGGIVSPLSILHEPAIASDKEFIAKVFVMIKENTMKLCDIIESGFSIMATQDRKSRMKDMKDYLERVSLRRHDIKIDRYIKGDWLEGESISWPVFTMIIEELLQNAGDACSSNGGQITLTASHTHNTIQCHIEDNGGGLHLENPSQVFEEGFTTKREQGGTGNGLYLIRRLLEHIGGNIEVYTDSEGGWTRFELEIPVWE